MGRRTVAQFAHQIKRVLSPTVLNGLGRRVGFCHRERLITPYRLVLGLLAGHATLQPKARGPLGEFGRIVIQDGCSFAVKDALREHYPGRFKKQNPAAVELHDDECAE